ncbi:hypothetical protein HW509_10575 [Asaia spathodeae]|uniref:hypothetical protein n=1 Tax=Asaia spathodeae TaxID=657016 RepID=UPI002FC3A0EC
MTHEQKPKSAEFQTREAQADWMAKCITASGDHPSLPGFLREHLRQSEARGAAEQRRKDAEGAEPVGYISENALKYLNSTSPLMRADIYGSANSGWPIPLYDRPANVAALEARVMELEGALAEVSKADDLGAKPDHHRCPVEQVAFELAWMCEEANISANDLVIVNREKLRTIARRAVARAAIREGEQP